LHYRMVRGCRAINQTRGPVLEVNDFYPFGLQIPGSSSEALKTNYSQNRYKYNGKEYDTAFSFNKNDFGARHYDPEIGRFGIIDPIAQRTLELRVLSHLLNYEI
jgi:RHS repeat-associated protein